MNEDIEVDQFKRDSLYEMILDSVKLMKQGIYPTEEVKSLMRPFFRSNWNEEEIALFITTKLVKDRVFLSYNIVKDMEKFLEKHENELRHA